MTGRKLSHYDLIEEISRGGIGIVYRAVDVTFGREVALKVPTIRPLSGSVAGRRSRTRMGCRSREEGRRTPSWRNEMISRTLLVLIALSAPAYAEVVRIEVKSRADVLAGKSFGTAGPYEKLSGTIYFAVDPRNSANQIITDIDKAPRERRRQGGVLFRLLPDQAEGCEPGNGTLLYEVSNRGGKAMIGFFNRGSGSLDPQTAAEFGDGFLLQQGFTLLWVGWQFDPPMRDGLVRVFAPIAREPDGRSIQGLVRSDFVPIEKTTQASLADRDHLAYTVSNPDDPANVLTVRDSVEGAPRTIPRDQWQFTEDGKAHPDGRGLRAQEDLRSGLPVAGPAGRRRGARRRARHDLEAEVRCDERAERAERRHQPRHRVRDLAERPVPPHVSVLRVQRGRVAPEGARRRDGARGRRRPRQLQSSLRPAVARCASVSEFLLSDGHLSVHRCRAARSGNRHA